jgi:Aspartyl protease
VSNVWFAARIALLCALGLPTLGAGRSDPDLAHLLDQMRGAAGPVWEAHFVSLSRLTLNGQANVVESEAEGLRITVKHCTGELCEGTYFDGMRLYSININGTALPDSSLPEPYLRALRLVASLEFLAPSFIARGGRINDAGDTTLNGKHYRTIFVADPSAVPLRLYIDPQSALIRFARPLNGEDTFEYRDYRRVGGFILPFEVLHNGHVLERYDNRAPVASAFHPPHGPLPVFTGRPAPIATDAKAVTPIVSCSIADIALRCLLDTGNSSLSMSSELASELGVPVVGTYQVRGLGGYSTQVVRAGPLRIGNATYPGAYYVVLNDLRHYGYDVVLGADILAASDVEIDPAAHSIRLAAAVTGDAITVPLSFQDFVPVVTVRLGELDARLAVDTGDESNINLTYDFYAKHPGLFSTTQRRQVSGIGGSSVEMIGEIPQVTIGDYRTGPQRIGTTETLQGTAFGHLGAAFLQQFKVEFDYAAAELHLVPEQ